MKQHWIEIEGELISLEDTPILLKNLNLMPIFLRRYFESKFTEKIIPSKDEQIEYQKKFMRRENIANKEDLKDWLKFNGVKESDLNLNIYNSVKLEKFKEDKFSQYVEEIFLKRKSSLDRVTYSIIRVKSKEKIVELHLRLKEEEATFPDLSAEFSEGIENVLHGLVGPLELGRVNPYIAERLKASKPGKLWPPFEIDGWWVILRHERLIPATLNDTMRQRLINEMYESWIMDKIKNALEKLEKTKV